MYAFGLSYRNVAEALGYLGVSTSPATVMRDVVSSGLRAQIQHYHDLLEKKVKVKRVGVDGTGVPMAGDPEDQGVVVVVDQDSGTGLLVEAVNEQDSEEMAAVLEKVFRLFAPEEVVTDEAGIYPDAIAEAAARTNHVPKHTLCAAHFRRNKTRRLRQLAEEARKHGRGLLAMEILAMLAFLRSPPDLMAAYAQRLYRAFLWARPPKKGEKASWAYRVKMLALEIGEKAGQVTGATNNPTEQFIGRAFKVRVKSMRGFKQTHNRICFLALALTLDAMRQRRGSISLS